MGSSLGGKAYAWRRWLVALLFVLTAAGFGLGYDAATVLEPGGFEVVDSPTLALERQLYERFGHTTPDVVAMYHAPDGDLDDPAIRSEMAEIVARVRADPAIEAVGSPLVLQDALVSADGSRWLVTVDLAGEEPEQQRAFHRIDDLLRSDALDEAIGGRVAANVETQEIARKDLVRAELISIPTVAILLVVFFRGLVAASLPLVVGAFAVAMSLTALRVLGSFFEISLFALNIVTFLGLGLAIDYALFMVQRFREELGVGNPPDIAVRNTVSTAGKTIAYSGLAVAASLLGLIWVPVNLLRSIAMAGTVVVLLTNLCAVVLLPALLGLLGRRVGGVRPQEVTQARRSTRFWRQAAAGCMRRPVVVTVLTSGFLLLCGVPFLRMQTVVSDARVFPPESEVRIVYDAISDPELFPRSGVDTHLLLVEMRTGESITSEAGVRSLFSLVEAIEALPGVDSVSSIVGAFDDPDTAVAALTRREALPSAIRARVEGAIDGNATLVQVDGAYPTSSPEARAQVAALERLDTRRLDVRVTGRAAEIAEIRDALGDRLPYAAVTVAGVIFLMLIMAFGAPVIAAKAVVMTALSLSASFGALVFIFQDGRLERLLNYASVGAVDPIIPVMMFAIIFGLSMDYELFLLSRIKEHHDKTHDNTESVSEGLTVTGPIISSAAILLLAVIAGLIAGSLIFLKELGVGMALAIIIDATLIRILLVPSTMALLGRWNWWAPGPLFRWWRRTGMGVAEGEVRRFESSDVVPPAPEAGR